MTAIDRRDTPLGGGLWLVASVAVPNLYVLALSVAIDASLGADGLGRQSLIAFAASAATTVAGSGGFVALVRSIASSLAAGDRAGARDIARWGVRLHAVTGAVLAAVVALPALWSDDLRGAWLVAAAVTLLGTLQMVPSAVLVGCRRWREVTVVGLVTGAVAVPATIAVLRAGGDVTGVLAVEAAMVAINLVAASLLAHRALPRAARAEVPARSRPERPWRFAALSAAGTTLTVLVWRRSELFVLSAVASDEEVARYSVAFGVSAVLLTLSERLSTFMTSSFAALVGDDPAPLRAAAARALRVLTVATLPLVAWAAALGPGALRVVYGDEYRESGAVLLVLLTTAAFLPAWTVSVAVLAARGDATSPLAVGAAAGALGLVAAVPLVAAHGALGAAVANVAGQAVTIAALGAVARRRAGGFAVDGASTGRAIAVAAGSGAAGWATVALVGGPLGLVLGGGAAIAATLLLAGALRPLTRADSAWLARPIGDGGQAGLAALLHRVARGDAEIPVAQAPATSE